MEEEKVAKTGTTTLGIVCKDGVVVATETRATMGTLIAHKETRKLYKIDDHLVLATAGLVGDIQILARYLNAEATLYRLKREVKMPVKSAATLMSNILNQRKFFPYYVQLIIAGYDNTGGHVYSLDAAGGAIPDKYTAGGSGSPYVYGVLEDTYRDDITTSEGVEIAIRAIHAAKSRDSASGGLTNIVIIDKDGYKELSQEEIEKLAEKIEKKSKQ